MPTTGEQILRDYWFSIVKTEVAIGVDLRQGGCCFGRKDIEDQYSYPSGD